MAFLILLDPQPVASPYLTFSSFPTKSVRRCNHTTENPILSQLNCQKQPSSGTARHCKIVDPGVHHVVLGGKPHAVGGTLQPWIGKQCMEMEVTRQSFSPFDAAEPNGFSRLPFTAGNRQVSVSSSSVAAQKGNYRVLTSA